MFEISAEVGVESGISIVKNANCPEKSDLTVLKSSFSTGDNSYKFELRADETGTIIYSEHPSDREEFFHEINVGKLAGEIEEAVRSEIDLQAEQNSLDNSEIEDIRQDILNERLEEVFWEEINQTLEDPFFRSYYDEDEWGEEFACECGTAAEFEEFLELCVLTEREITLPDDYLFVEAETEFEEAGLSEGSYHTERLEDLVKIACDYFKPSGFRYDYNDGCYDRYSGYSMSSESISISLLESSKTPAREKMLGMTRLREKLISMDVETKLVEKLTAF